MNYDPEQHFQGQYARELLMQRQLRVASEDARLNALLEEANEQLRLENQLLQDRLAALTIECDFFLDVAA